MLFAAFLCASFFVSGCGGSGGADGDPLDQWLSRTVSAIEAKSISAFSETVSESFSDECNQVSRTEYLDGWEQLFLAARTIDIQNAGFDYRNMGEGTATVGVSGRARVTFWDGSTEERDVAWATRLLQEDDGVWRDRGQGLDQCPTSPVWLTNLKR